MTGRRLTGFAGVVALLTAGCGDLVERPQAAGPGARTLLTLGASGPTFDRSDDLRFALAGEAVLVAPVERRLRLLRVDLVGGASEVALRDRPSLGGSEVQVD